MMTSIHCKHFNGVRSVVCEAGVKYEDVELGKGTPKYSLPCIKASPISRTLRNELGATCEKCLMPTEEELMAQVLEMQDDMEKTMMVRQSIVKHLGGPWKRGMKGSAGSIDCPACGKGRVNFTRSGYNGHIHAKCSTDNCVAWME